MSCEDDEHAHDYLEWARLWGPEGKFTVTYTCPQCGPDPRGGEVHAADYHTAGLPLTVISERPPMQNFPETPAHSLERSLAGQKFDTLTLSRAQSCAHCGERTVRSGDRDHLCCAAIMDWLDGLRGTEHEPYTMTDLLGVLDELGL